MESSRRFEQLERDLAEANERQTAADEVLEVIGRSAFELEPVFETVLGQALRLCGAAAGQVWVLDEDVYRLAFAIGGSQSYRDYLAGVPIARGGGTLVGRVGLERRTVQILDAVADPDYEMHRARELGGFRTMLGVPMLAQKIRHEEVLRVIVDLVGRPDLLDDARVHHRDLGRHRHRFDLVVRDVDDRRLELVVELLDLEPHLGAEFCVEVRQRLVEQEQRDLLDERAAYRDALPLPARELSGFSVEERVDLQELCRPGDALIDLAVASFSRRSPKRRFPVDRLGRVERVGLEHHREAAVLRVAVGDVSPSMMTAPRSPRSGPRAG